MYKSFTTIDTGPYSIKNLKTFKGMEGMGGFNLTLYKNGKRIGEVLNDDCGACHMYQLPNSEFKVLLDHAKKVLGDEFEVEDYFIDEMINSLVNLKRFKSLSKHKTLFRLKGMDDGEWKSFNRKYDPQIRNAIVQKYGDEVEVILDEKLDNVLEI